MIEDSTFPIDRVGSVAKMLAVHVGNQRLREAMTESRLARKNRDELRRLFPDHSAWSRHVIGAVQRIETREPALRALNILVNDFVDLARIDARVKVVVRK